MAQSEAQKNAPTQLVGKNAPLNKLPKSFPTEIDETLSLGLDLGVGSCGQALVYQTPESSKTSKLKLHELRGDERIPTEFPHLIEFLGVRTFDIPETKEKTGVKLKNPERRGKRGLRKTTRRRASRLWKIKRLLKNHGLLPAEYPTEESLWKKRPNETPDPLVKKWNDWHSQTKPLELRVAGLDRKLEPLEFAAVLIHLAKHRGFRSNRKGEAADAEGGKVLTALSQHAERMAEGNYRTFGEMLLNHPDFAERKRNREGNYMGTPQRTLQLEEIEILFKRQQELGNNLASQELESAYKPLFFDQKPLQNSFHLLGDCPFEPSEKRGSRYAPSFELSRALQKLNHLTLLTPDQGKVRLADYVDAQNGGYQAFVDAFSTTGTNSNPGRISWKDLRDIFELDSEITFPDLPEAKVKLDKKGNPKAPISIKSLENEDFCTRSNANASTKGSYLLREALGEKLWNEYFPNQLETLDKIAFALSFFEEIENEQEIQEYWSIERELVEQKIPQELRDTILENLNSNHPTLGKFNGATGTSSLFSRKLLTPLKQGLVYSEACESLYGDHRQQGENFNDITNPVVKSVVRECLKQVIHLIEQVGVIPGRINVELARDLGKSVDERNEMTRGLEKRTKERNKNRETFIKSYGRTPNDQELLAYELWLEQNCLCPYSGETLPNPLSWQTQMPDIDHILPRSRSHDNSFHNKVLVTPASNRNKGNRTPSEWMGTDSEAWRKFQATLKHMPSLGKEKRRHLLNTSFAEDEAKFASRHLNDTRYISRLVTHYLSAIYEIAGEQAAGSKGSKRRVFAQPGSLTAIVRKAWNLENLKKDRDGRRLGDKHHAIDALICALLSEGQRQFVTRDEQQKYAAREVPVFADIARSYELMEQQNNTNRIPSGLKAPKGWDSLDDFRANVVTALDCFTVSRRESRRGRGSLHQDTIYRVEEVEGQETTYSRKSILDTSLSKTKPAISLDKLHKIKDIDDPRNAWLKNALTNWLKAGGSCEPADLPRDPSGALIRKVTIDQGKQSGRFQPQGFVTSGDQVRVDVFSQTKNNGTKNYYLVPIYTYHLENENPPLHAIVANKDEEHWELMQEEHQFEFSLWPNSRFEVGKTNGEYTHGLYNGVGRRNCRINFSNPDDSSENPSPPKGGIKTPGVSVKTNVTLFRKLQTDRLGRLFSVPHEPRMWRGQVCDSHTHCPQVL